MQLRAAEFKSKKLRQGYGSETGLKASQETLAKAQDNSLAYTKLGKTKTGSGDETPQQETAKTKQTRRNATKQTPAKTNQFRLPY